MVHEHRLHGGAVRQFQQDLMGQAVLGPVFLQHLHLAGGNGIVLCQKLPGLLAQVAHLTEIHGSFLIQPAEYLLRPEFLQALTHEFRLEFFQGQAHDLFFRHSLLSFVFSNRHR